MCQKSDFYNNISYLCTAKRHYPIVAHHFAAALIVQRIERGFPKPKIWVRFPVGVRFISANKRILSLLADFLFIVG